MRIRDIYERYEIPSEIARVALTKAAFVAQIRNEWVGQTIDWSVLTRATLFGDLGDSETTKLVRKKVGLDKFIASVIERGVIERSEKICASHDTYQQIYLYVTLAFQDKLSESERAVFSVLEEVLSNNVLSTISEIRTDVPEKDVQKFLDLDIKHYKNPSV